jgi:hypothetical protein
LASADNSLTAAEPESTEHGPAGRNTLPGEHRRRHETVPSSLLVRVRRTRRRNAAERQAQNAGKHGTLTFPGNTNSPQKTRLTSGLTQVQKLYRTAEHRPAEQNTSLLGKEKQKGRTRRM